MQEVEIGRASAAHLDDILALQLELGEHHRELEPQNPRYQLLEEEWRAQLETALIEGRSRFLVATRDGDVCGFVRIMMVEKPWGLSCEMDTLVVTSSARGQRVGTLLVGAAEREARSLGARAMRTNVLSSNERGRVFYEGNGYSEIAVRFGKPL